MTQNVDKIETLRETLGLPQEIYFKVKGWTNFCVHFGKMPTNEYFSTQASNRGGCGQCQDRALEGPECGLARAFWLRYDKWHIQALDKIPLEELHNMKKDLEILKQNYSHGRYESEIKWNRKNKSRDIGNLVYSGLTLTEIVERLELPKTLNKELSSNNQTTKKMKI